MMRWRLILVLVAAAALVVPAHVTASSETRTTDGSLAAGEDVVISGPSSSTLTGGAIHLHTDTLAGTSIALSAEAIELKYTWVRGYDVGRDGRDPVTRRTTDQGSDSFHVEGTQVTIEQLNAEPELLGAGQTASRLQAQAEEDTRFSIWEDRWITRVGHGNKTMRLMGPPERGFAYQVEGPWIASQGVDSATLEGNFSLFVHNVTLGGGSPTNGSWSHWTGEKVLSEPGPGVREVERRFTMVTVTHGILRIDAPGTLAVTGPSVEVDLQGRVTASSVSGLVSTDASVFRYDDDRLDMVGQGLVRLSPLPAGGASRGIHTLEEDTQTHLEVEGLFDIRETAGMTVEPQMAQGSQAGWMSGWLPWIPLVLVVAAVGALAAPRVERWWAALQAKRRKDRESLWMATGDRLFEVREFKAALKWYRRVVDAYPRSPQGWNSVAACLEEIESHAEASDAYERTARLLDDDPQMLLSATTCSWRAGQRERAARLAREALRIDETLGRRRLSGPRFDELREHPKVRSWFQDGGSDPGASYV